MARVVAARRDVTALLQELHLATVITESDIEDIASDLMDEYQEDLETESLGDEPSDIVRATPMKVTKSRSERRETFEKAERDAYEAQLRERDARINGMHEQVAEYKHQYELACMERDDLRTKLHGTSQKIHDLEEKCRSAPPSHIVQTLQERLAERESTVQSLMLQLSDAKTRCARLEIDCSEWRDKCAVLESEKQRLSSASAVRDVQDQLMSALEKVRLLELDKTYLSRESDRAVARVSVLEEELRRAHASRDELFSRWQTDLTQQQQQQAANMARNPLVEELQRRDREVERMQENLRRQIDEMRTESRATLERETRILRESRDAAVLESETLRVTLRETQEKMHELQAEYRRMRGHLEGELSELRAVVKIKTYEAERASLALEEARAAMKTLQRESQMLRQKLDASKDEYYRLLATVKDGDGSGTSGDKKGDEALKVSDVLAMLTQERDELSQLRRQNLELQTDIAKLLAHRETVARIRETLAAKSRRDERKYGIAGAFANGNGSPTNKTYESDFESEDAESHASEVHDLGGTTAGGTGAGAADAEMSREKDGSFMLMPERDAGLTLEAPSLIMTSAPGSPERSRMSHVSFVEEESFASSNVAPIVITK
jgi:chromosome segregation ATPase